MLDLKRDPNNVERAGYFGDFMFQAVLSIAVDAQPEKLDCRALNVWLCLPLAEVFPASSLCWEPRFDWEKELNP